MSPKPDLKLPRPRYEEAFSDALLELQAGKPIPPLIFHGVAGIGKTVLLERFQDLCGSAVPFSAIKLDRDMTLSAGLRELADGLEHHRVSLQSYRHVDGMLLAKRQGVPPKVRVADALEQLDKRHRLLAGSLELFGKSVGAVPLVSAIIGVGLGVVEELANTTRGRAFLHHFGGDKEFLRLLALTTQDLEEELLPVFAKDLGDFTRRAPADVVLFFDAYERLSTGQDVERGDRWLQNLRKGLSEAAPSVLMVFAGQEGFRQYWEPVRHHRVVGFTRRDAEKFLELSIARPAPSPDLPRELIDAALDTSAESGAGDSFHCGTLELVAIMVSGHVEKRGDYPKAHECAPWRGQGSTELAVRFFETLDKASAALVKYLALPSRLDEELVWKITDGLRLPAVGQIEMDRLERLGILTRSQEGDLELHRTIRAIVRQALAKDLPPRATDQVFRLSHQHWESRDRPAAWYSLLKLEPDVALRELRDEQGSAVRDVNSLRLEELLYWWRPVEHLASGPQNEQEAREHAAYAETLAEQIGIDRSRFRDLAIAHLIAAGSVVSREKSPALWARIQDVLGATYLRRLAEERASADFDLALEHLRRAAEVWASLDDRPALALNAFRRGGLYLARIEAGDSEEADPADAKAAAGLFSEALQAWTLERDRFDWLDAHLNLGDSYGYMNDVEYREESKRQYQIVLDHVDANSYPDLWARAQLALGCAHVWEAASLHNSSIVADGGDADGALDARVEEVAGRAKHFLNRALEVFTETANPYEWAKVQFNLGQAAAMDRDGPARAVEHYRNAQTVWTADRYPVDWQECMDEINYLESSEDD